MPHTLPEDFLSGEEIFFEENEVIVSKTDLKGHITYANDVFVRVSGYAEAELIGAPHSILRHPNMPRSVFKLLWDTLAQGSEIFAFVINRNKHGHHYWVLAHVTPSFNAAGEIIAFHSSRRCPNKEIINHVITPLYAAVLAEENKYANRKEGMLAGEKMVLSMLTEKGIAYDELIFSLLNT
jgi:PAS domain S-box-containing protein